MLAAIWSLKSADVLYGWSLFILSKLQGDGSFVTFIDSPLKTINCRTKRKFTFVHLRGDSGRNISQKIIDKLMQGLNGLEKKIGWYKHLNLKLSKSTFRMQFARSAIRPQLSKSTFLPKLLCSSNRILDLTSQGTLMEKSIWLWQLGWPKLYIPSTITTRLMFWHTKFSAIIMSYRPWTTASGQSCSNKIIKIFKNDFFWKTLLMRMHKKIP